MSFRCTKDCVVERKVIWESDKGGGGACLWFGGYLQRSDFSASIGHNFVRLPVVLVTWSPNRTAVNAS